MEFADYSKTNLNTIKEMILDEEKLVTYITLSKDLCLHVNSSKKILCYAVKQIREEQPNLKLNVSYIISGLSGNNRATTSICTENDLEKLLKSLNIIFFYHIYSVCKGSSRIDNVALLLSNKYEDFSLCTGMIKSTECNKRTSDEIGNLKKNSQEVIILKHIENKPLISTTKKLKQEPNHVSEVLTNGTIEEKHVKLVETKSEIKIKTEITSPTQESNTKQTIQKINGLKTQKGIASFFNKSNSLQNRNVSNETKDNKFKDEKLGIDNKNRGLDKNTKIELLEKLEKDSNYKDNQIIKKEHNRDVKNNDLNNIKKLAKVDKKRKRVLHVSDSEGEEGNGTFANNQEINNESDDEIPPTPSANNYIKITSGIVNPKKKRKVIDKTYTDDDGYILTKKEEIYESYSENEDELKTEKEVKVVEFETSPKIKKNIPKKLKKKISPPQKGKQSTLNHFFNKK